MQPKKQYEKCFTHSLSHIFPKYVSFQPHPPSLMSHFTNWRIGCWRMNLHQEGHQAGTSPQKHCHHNSERHEFCAFCPCHYKSCACCLKCFRFPEVAAAHAEAALEAALATGYSSGYSSATGVSCFPITWMRMLSHDIKCLSAVVMLFHAKIAHSASVPDGHDNTIKAANNCNDSKNFLFTTTIHQNLKNPWPVLEVSGSSLLPAKFFFFHFTENCQAPTILGTTLPHKFSTAITFTHHARGPAFSRSQGLAKV